MLQKEEVEAFRALPGRLDSCVQKEPEMKPLHQAPFCCLLLLSCLSQCWAITVPAHVGHGPSGLCPLIKLEMEMGGEEPGPGQSHPSSCRTSPPSPAQGSRLPSDGVEPAPQHRGPHVAARGCHARDSGPGISANVIGFHRGEMCRPIEPTHHINVVIQQSHSSP